MGPVPLAGDFTGSIQVSFASGVRVVGEAKSTMSGMTKSFRSIMSHRTGKIEMFGTSGNGKLVLQ